MSAWLVPCGDANQKIVAVACDDPKSEVFRNASRKALCVLGRHVQDALHVQDASFGSRAHKVPKKLLEALLQADPRNRERHCLDVAVVTVGPVRGLQVVGIGSNTMKRERAVKAALVLAVREGFAGIRPEAVSPDLKTFLPTLQLVGHVGPPPLQKVEKATQPMGMSNENDRLVAAEGREAAQQARRLVAPPYPCARPEDDVPNQKLHAPATASIRRPDPDHGAVGKQSILNIPVDEVLYTQESCGTLFSDGQRSLQQLVEELVEGRHDPLTSEFLWLEAVSKRGKLFSNDNRRLWCLKEYQRRCGREVWIRIRVEKLPPAARRFVERYDPVKWQEKTSASFGARAFDEYSSLFDSTGEVLKDDRFIRAVPTDKRLPTMLLQINNVTTKALRLPGKLDRFQLWPMQIQVWNETSKHPLCRLQGSCLGRAGSLEAEERHALIANELDSHDVDFCEEELDEVDQIVQAAQRDFESEAASRMDLRQKRIFTIDPATAKDLDDAIHVEDLKGKGQIEVGVHIADVAHFLKLGSITDEEARRRTTSVYLIGRVLPMLPHGLCNYLCSLNPNEPKLAFSAFFRLCKRTGQLIENPAPWFAKTAISSVCRLNYEQAQDIIDDLDIEEEDRPLVHGGYTWQQIKDDILLLYEVCGKVRHGRLTGGAMTISKTKMVFHTRDSEDGIPTGYHLESHSASHWVIEELMLLANRCVAKRLAMSELSEVAVLRNHKPPDLKKAETLQKLMRERLGIKDFSMSSAFAIYKSCQDIYQKHGKMLGLCVEMMIMRAGMKQAEYFLYGVVEEEEEEHCPHHFALNFDYYTHFTSPIRRYPDVMVHRVLCALLDRQMEPRGPAEEGEEEGPAFFQTRDEAKEQVKICNEKKMNSRRCQEQLDRAVFCIYLRSMKSWCYTVGTILAMTRNERDGDSLTVYCSQLGRESKVTLCRASAEEDNVELFRNGVDDELLLPDNWEWLGRGAIQITWRSREDKEEVQKLQTLSCIPIVIIPTNTVPIDYALFVVSPFHKKYSEVKADIKESEFDGFTWTEEDEEGVDVVYNEGIVMQLGSRLVLLSELLWMELLNDGGGVLRLRKGRLGSPAPHRVRRASMEGPPFAGLRETSGANGGKSSSPSTPKQIESPVQRSVDGNPGRKSMVNVNSEFVKGKPTKHSATHGCRGKLAKLLQSSQLMNIMAMVILVDALVTVVDVDARAAGNEPPRAMMALSDICLCMYTAELLAMIFVGGLRIFLSWMPLLDLLIVLCGYAEMVMASFLTPEEVGAMSLLRALRLVRISRLMRLLRKSRSLKELQKLATMMTTCFKALLWSFLLCFVIMTLWAMLMVEMLHPLIKDNPDFASCGDLCLEATSSVMRANLLLFQTVIAGDSWGLIAVPLILKHPETAIIFVLSLLTLVFGVLNLIVAVVIDMFAEARERDMVNLAEELEYELEDDKKYLQKLFDRMDANNDGELCFEELMAGAGRDPEFQSRLRVMDIDQADLQMLFDMVDLNGDGMIQPTEFIGPLSRWARDSKTAPRFVKYNLMKMQAQQEELFYLSDFYLRSLSDRLDTLTSKMCPDERDSEGNATPRSGTSEAEVHSMAESEVIEPPAASAPVFPPFPSHPRTESPADPADLGKQLAGLPVEHVEEAPLQHSEDLVRQLRGELSRTERHLQASMEESLKRSVAKIEGLLKENACVSSPDFGPRPLRSSVPHAFGRKSITLHHEKVHLPTFEGRHFPHKFEALGQPPVKDLVAQPKPGE
ncbi:dis3l2 [Symbiodinium sp. KB8]|nr:dis3l2 [Symbiodinium sp. KB8]